MFNPVLTEDQAGKLEAVIETDINREIVKGMKDSDFDIFKKEE